MEHSDNSRPSVAKSQIGVASKVVELDDILVNELGQFGWFQFRNICLVAIPVIMSAFMSEYIFSAANIPHRCHIPECGEDDKNLMNERDWLGAAIPPDNSNTSWASCRRYQPLGSNGSLQECPASLFDRSTEVACDGYVYGSSNSVVYEFDLGCQEWLRALAGTFHSVGTLLVLPITGYVSDRYGRRVALIINVFNIGLFGVITAFSVNYPMYLVLQLLQTTLGAGAVSSAYIFAAEWVGPQYRVLTSATTMSMFSVGQVILAFVSWQVQPWRYTILVLHIPCFLIISYYWLLTESVRWLLSKKRFDEAKEILLNVARINKKQVSESSLLALTNPPETLNEESHPALVCTIWKSSILRRRVCTTPIWWISATFVYYGLSINSTGLSDTIYMNYMLTSAIEIPGFFTAVLVLDRIGRKSTLSCGFFFSAACNIAFAFIPRDLEILRLVIYLLGKFGISTVFTSLYLYTSELYPTMYRHTLLAFSSMIGRIGSIAAPLTPPLVEYWTGLPSVMFGVTGLLSGFLVLTQPETLGTKMPDTLEEAETVGSRKLSK